MIRHTNLLPKKLIEYNEEATSDLLLNDMVIKEKTLQTPALKTKWLMIYLEEKKYLKDLKKALEIKEEEYIAKHGQPGVPRIKTKKESESSDEIKKIKEMISIEYDVIEYIEGINKIFCTFGFDIKNSIDIIKMEN